MRFTYLDILEQCFHDRFLGYDRKEVDTFLHLLAEDFKDITEETEQLKNEVSTKYNQISDLEEQIKVLKSKNGNGYKEALEQLSGIRQKAQNILKQTQDQIRLKHEKSEKELNRIRKEIKFLKGERQSLLDDFKTGAKTYLESLHKNKQNHVSSDPKG